MAFGALLAAGVGGAATERTAAVPDKALARAITPGHLRTHLQALARIASRNDGNRAAGTPGYSKSVDYVAAQLRKAGYRPRFTNFRFPYFRETQPTVFERVLPSARSYQAGRDFVTMRYSGGGNVNARVVPVDLSSSTSGCEDSDFAGFTSGSVALMKRGGCTFTQKARSALVHGAAAALIANDGSPGRTAPISASLFGSLPIPVMVVSSELASELASLAQIGPVQARIMMTVATTLVNAANVTADLQGRRPGVVLLGGHLDSVANGPGINDNGSGSAVILEIARQARRLHIRPKHGLRFAWWGAEELGLIGSRNYVEGLTNAQRKRILDVINLDMVGSPNFARIVYAGEGQPRGSLRIENAFRAYFRSRRLAVAEASLGGSSDHAAFAQAGIPVGGLFTGADEAKSADAARLFGGSAGQAYDACYHKSCDTVANVDFTILDQMADAAAVVALRLSR